MSALDCIERLSKTSIYKDLRYCLVSEDKIPYKIDNTKASPNKIEDFVDFNMLLTSNYLLDKKGVGISVQFSNICGVDIDHCFSTPNDFSSGDARAIDIFNLFKDFSYIEFSFSGTGMRILFRTEDIVDYRLKYLIKNSKNQVEYYQPYYGDEKISYRYLTLTGNTIIDKDIEKPIKQADRERLYLFLDKYMKREKTLVKSSENEIIKDNRSIEDLMKKVRILLLKDYSFQDNWFKKAPGSNSNESERDYWLISELYHNVTKDPDRLIEIFEKSDFYKSKDYKHKYKWHNNNYRYFKLIYENISSS